MRRLRVGIVWSKLAVASKCLAPICLAVALAGCAASSAADRSAGAPAGERATRINLEGDGLPAQVSPPRSVREAPDDPAEPYSPLYGSRPPHPVGETEQPWSSPQEDAIIAAAITAHEIRRP